MASKSNSIESPGLTFPFPDPTQRWLIYTYDIFVYVWYTFYILYYTYVRYISSPKICNHTVVFIKVVYLHPWDDFFVCYLKKCFQNLLLLPRPQDTMITFVISGWNQHIFQEFISKGFIFGSGPFSTTRNRRNGLKGALIKEWQLVKALFHRYNMLFHFC